MRALLQKSLLLSSVVAALSFFPAAVSAQAVRGTLNTPTFDDLQSPDFGGSAGRQKSFRPGNWLEVEARVRLDMRPEPPSKMAERVTVRWYVAVKNPDGQGMLLLTREVNHVNVPLGSDVFFSVYLTPASLQRLTGSDRAGKNAVEMVGYEVIVNGEQVGTSTTRTPGNLPAEWWNVQSPSLSRSDTVPLLNKAESAFAHMWWDRYAEVLIER